MADDRERNPDGPIEPEDVESPPSVVNTGDPNDEIPVPIAMSPAEIDERAQVVEALRGKAPPRTDDDTRLET